MTPVRLGSVGYLNARPLVFGLDRSPRFDLRFDLPSECARLLHAREIDIGMIPSIEYLRGDSYRIVPDVAIASRGPVASVALFTTRPMSDVRSIVMDTSSRTSVALVRVLCARLFKIEPAIEAHSPDLNAMLDRGDAALIIGDKALVWDLETVRLPSLPLRPGKPDTTYGNDMVRRKPDSIIQKIDLGEAWTSLTGLPFVWAFWAGPAGALSAEDVSALQEARQAGVQHSDAIGREYFRDAPEHRDLGARYLRDNIKYYLGAEERAGLDLFYRYAAEVGLVDAAPGRQAVRFY
jgi:chorismate dehydratase